MSTFFEAVRSYTPVVTPRTYDREREAAKWAAQKKRRETEKTRMGKMIRSLEEVMSPEFQGRSVYIAHWGAMPVAFFISMQARIVGQLILAGRVYRYLTP